MYKRLFTAAIIFGAAALAPPLAAEIPGNCLSRDKLIEYLRKDYHETPRGAGLQGPHQMLEIWSSPETGSFTVLVTYADGTSCVVATGRYWQDAPPAPADNTAG